MYGRSEFFKEYALITPNRPTLFVFTGLPGSGKTTLVNMLRPHFEKDTGYINADWVRETVSSDLGWSKNDKLVQAERLGVISASAFYGCKSNRCVVLECFSALKSSWSAFSNSFHLVVPNMFLRVVRVHLETIDVSQAKFAVEYEKPDPSHYDLVITKWTTSEELNKLVDTLNSLIAEPPSASSFYRFVVQ
jgi:Adenylylsulphate kinase